MILPLSVHRLLLTWLSLAVLMSANGVFRELALRRVFDTTSADMVSAIIGMAVIGAVTALGFRPLQRAESSVGALAVTSGILVVLTVMFETVLGRVVDDKSWDALAAHYAIWRGELWPIVLLWLACTPFLWARAARAA